MKKKISHQRIYFATGTASASSSKTIRLLTITTLEIRIDYSLARFSLIRQHYQVTTCRTTNFSTACNRNESWRIAAINPRKRERQRETERERIKTTRNLNIWQFLYSIPIAINFNPKCAIETTSLQTMSTIFFLIWELSYNTTTFHKEKKNKN